MTRDLEGFWAGGYAQMKKEVAGRYPATRGRTTRATALVAALR
jgi:hypothetical protein